MARTFVHQLPSKAKAALTVNRLQGMSSNLIYFSLEETPSPTSNTIQALGYFPTEHAADIATAILRESGLAGGLFKDEFWSEVLTLTEKFSSEELFRLATHALEKGIIVRAKEAKEDAAQQAREELARVLWEAGDPQPRKTPWGNLMPQSRERWLAKADAALAHINTTNEK